MKNFLKYHLKPLLKINKHPSFYSSHSQFGEDMILRSLFGDRKTGFFIDIGAHHPIYYSNTYHFYLKGWRGLNIDALPGSMSIFNSLRDKDFNVEACISNRDNEDVLFHEFTKPAINTFDPHYAEELTKKGETLIKKVPLKTKTLSTILSDKGLMDKTIDFLTIDIEGVDSIVLKSLDMKAVRPKVIVFEDHSYQLMKPHESDLLQYLIQNNYELIAKTGPSLFVKDVLCKSL